MATAFGPEVVLLDLGLPQMDGYEVARRSRNDESFKGVLLIAVTGYSQDSDRARAEAAGFDLHVPKSLEPDKLGNCWLAYIHARSLHPRRLLANRAVLVAGALLLLFQAVFTYLSAFQTGFGTAPLELRDWLWATGAGVAVFLVVEVGKAVLRGHRRRQARGEELVGRPGRCQGWRGGGRSRCEPLSPMEAGAHAGGPAPRSPMLKHILIVALLAGGTVTLPEAPAAAATEPLAPAGDEVLELRLVELMAIDYRRGRRLPDWALALDGREVRIEGYMAIGTPEGEERFELVWDSCGCGTSQPHHFVEVTLPDGEGTEFHPDLLVAEGRFEVGEVIEDGFVKSLFRLKADKIED